MLNDFGFPFQAMGDFFSTNITETVVYPATRSVTLQGLPTLMAWS